MDTPENADLDRLLEHTGWARALARSLVRDSHRADDLVQQTWLAALEHPPGKTTPIRSWLAAVMRNFARQDARADERRDRREERGARHEALPPQNALEGEVELQRTLLEAVRALAEPYRSTIWARYYEGLAPRAIAAREGLPLKTVKTRLHRGLHELRARLDRSHGGDRRAWLAALLPLARPPSLSATTIGALLVSTEVKVACGLVAVVGVIAVWRVSADSSPMEVDIASQPARTASALESEPAHEPVLDAPKLAGARAPLAAEKSAPVAPTAKAADPLVVHGRVLDLERWPVAGVAIALRTRSRETSAAAPALDVLSSYDRRFELRAPESNFDLGVSSEAWVEVYAARLWSERAHPDVTIFVAPRRPLAGVVVDGERRGIAHADVEILLDPGLRRNLGTVLDANIARIWSTRTDARGQFEWNDAPLTASSLSVRAVGWNPQSIETPARPTFDMEIVLTPVEKAHALVRGRVVDSERKPIEGAYVALGSETHTSRANGGFEFDLDAMKGLDWMEATPDGSFEPVHDARTIIAAKSGCLPAQAAIPDIEELHRSSGPHEVELVLGAKPLEIHGRVVDKDGRAVPDVIVRAQGETHFGMLSERTEAAEVSFKTSIEALLRGTPRWADVTTAADGAFAITGLLDKEYGLLALDRKTLRLATLEKVRAGSGDVLIQLPSDEECVPVAGRVVSPTGDPVADVRVNVAREGLTPDESGATIFGSSVVTDAQGRFTFAKLARTGLTFQVSGKEIFLLIRWTPKPEDRLDDLAIPVSHLCHVQIDLGERKELADHAQAVDANGGHIPLLAVHGDISWSPDQFLIENGRSEALACGETARTIVLYAGGREVERVPFTPRPGELVVVTP